MAGAAMRGPGARSPAVPGAVRLLAALTGCSDADADADQDSVRDPDSGGSGASPTVRPRAVVTVADSESPARTVTATGAKAFGRGDNAPGRTAGSTAPPPAGSHPCTRAVRPFFTATPTVG